MQEAKRGAYQGGAGGLSPVAEVWEWNSLSSGRRCGKDPRHDRTCSGLCVGSHRMGLQHSRNKVSIRRHAFTWRILDALRPDPLPDRGCTPSSPSWPYILQSVGVVNVWGTSSRVFAVHLIFVARLRGDYVNHCKMILQ